MLMDLAGLDVTRQLEHIAELAVSQLFPQPCEHPGHGKGMKKS